MTRLLRLLPLLALFTVASSIALPHEDHDDADTDLPDLPSSPPKTLQQVLNSWPDNPASRYPTDFTRDIAPKAIHSHNDYWRATPLFSALSVGAISVEADVWLLNDTLLVGHDPASLTPARNLSSLYISPLVELLERQKPGGVFDTNPLQTLYLWIDVKTSGKKTWAKVVEELEPLRQRKWLSSTGSNGVVWRPVTVIGTGNAPYAQIGERRDRDYFVDANLADMDEPPTASDISPFASTSLRKAVGEIAADGMTEKQIAIVEAQIAKAGWRGIKARYWDVPSWPKRKREKVWRQLFDLGVGLLSVDELEEAAEGMW